MQDYVKLLACGHFLHEECIREWREETHECPVAKKKFENNENDSEGSRIQRDAIMDITWGILYERHP